MEEPKTMFRRSSGAQAIGEVLLIAIVVVVGAMVGTIATVFTSGVFWSTVSDNPSVSIVIEDARPGASNITLVHLGKEKVENAFAPSSPPSYFVDAVIFEDIEVRINGLVYEGWASLNRGEIAKPGFEVGDEFELGLGSGWTLSPGDRIMVIYVPGGHVLAAQNV